ncbi:MAG TPA: peptide-N-glycosidase F-related protein [Bacteroidia bacterium]|nr:peptide-N-glycosidase F-related protein [Bacteroidia bacterium]
MKKIILTLFTALSATLYAAPGDTTWIQANNVQLNYYNNFDTAVAFPNGSTSYRKILMVFTLGEYACPAGSQYCHQWDYTVTNYVMTKTDTVELSRFITPFANTGVPRFPSTWTQHYMYDVTDFYTLLKDSATIRINYSGYSGGFTASIKFAFIEGTPERNILGVDPLWIGSFTYGKSSDPIANHLPVKTLTAPAGTQSSELKLTVTGHGSDNTTQCCEFASHNYSVSVNNVVVAGKAVWRDDCGLNELYAQGGTWIFNRGNWCPGDAVNTNTHPLVAATANSTYSLGLKFDAYTTTGNYGSYSIGSHVFYYSNFNHAVDASLNDIISPSSYEDHFRENPSGNSPVVRVHNAGSSTISSITFSYNVKDSAATQYTWNGTLLSQQDTNITLAPLNSLTNMSLSGSNGIYLFNAKIISVNGAADEDSTNNSFQSQFVAAPTWPTALIITLNTNSEGINFVGSGDQSETTWQITDLNNNVIASRVVDSTNMNYVDTVILPNLGYYNLSINDAGCDGLHWWVWDQNPSYGITAGSLTVQNFSTGASIPMKGYSYSGTFHDDFGCNFSQYFTTGGAITGIHNPAPKNIVPALTAYPNPAQNNITVTLTNVEPAKGQFEIIDGQGRVVLQQKAAGLSNTINVSSLSNGIYTVLYTDAKVPKIQTRLFIVK